MTDSEQKLISTFSQLKFELNANLAPLTYFKIGGPAQVLVKVNEKQDLINLVRFCQKENFKFTVLGGASNVIVCDQGISGLVIFVKFNHIELISKDEDQGLLRAEAGIKTALFVSRTINDYGLAGLENFLGVPGTLGGAIYNNAHYLEKLLSRYIKRVNIIDEKGDVRWIDKAECDFGYDSSRFHQTNEVILEAEFVLPLGDIEESKSLVKKATLYRAKSQPLAEPSSGCIFKNVLNNEKLKQKFPQFADRRHVPTGFLIDQAGLKGARQGDIEISHKHAAFFINKGQGKAKDVEKLIEKVQSVLEKKYEVKPEPEVFWLE